MWWLYQTLLRLRVKDRRHTLSGRLPSWTNFDHRECSRLGFYSCLEISNKWLREFRPDSSRRVTFKIGMAMNGSRVNNRRGLES